MAQPLGGEFPGAGIIADGTPLYACDPGHINLMSQCKETYVYGKNWDAYDPPITTKVELNKKEFYNRVHVKTKKNNELTTKLRRCSVKTTNTKVLYANVQERIRLQPEVWATWGTRGERTKKFLRMRKKAKFYGGFVTKYFPERNAVIFWGHAKVTAVMKGTTTAPTGKLKRATCKRRRVINTYEYKTTQKCSFCRPVDLKMKELWDNYKGKQFSAITGKYYFSKLHDLRQCTICHTTWGRDFNAARNILFSGLHQLHSGGERPDYLQRTPNGDS